jgi:Na+-driven multidrug efflux pump
LQSTLFSLGFLMFFWITDKLGPAELGASHVLVTLALVSILPSVGIGLGAASLVGQSLGAGRPADARVWGWLALGSGLVFGVITGLIAIFAAPQLLEAFIGGDQKTVALAVTPLRIIGVVMIIDACGVVLSNTLIGAGAAQQVMMWSVASQWCVFLPIAWFIGLLGGYGIDALWFGFAMYRFVFGSAMVYAWRGNSWQTTSIG